MNKKKIVTFRNQLTFMLLLLFVNKTFSVKVPAKLLMCKELLSVDAAKIVYNFELTRLDLLAFFILSDLNRSDFDLSSFT